MAEALNRTEREFLLNCGICGGRLTDPRILDCLHSFCKECLVIKQEQATKKDVVICELCGTHTRLSNDSIDSLTTNIFVTNIGRVEEITNSNCSFYCTFCEDQGDWEEASSRCLTCGDWLCLACAGRHCGTTVTKRHKVVTLDDEVEFEGSADEDSDVEETEDEDDLLDTSDNDQMSNDAENNAIRPPFNVPVVPRKSAKTVDDEDIIATLNVNGHRTIPLSIQIDQTPPEIFDISWLTDTEFAVGDKANQRIKVFGDDGTFLWQKDIQEGLIERIACVNGVVASDFPSGVHLDTRHDSFQKIYYQCTVKRTNPYPIAKTNGKEVIIGNADFPELRCYTKNGKRIRYLSLGKKLKINYIAQDENKAFLFTEKDSTIVKKFQEGQGISKFFEGLPGGWVPEGVATDSENNVYVSDSASSDIVKLSPQGKLLGVLGVHPTSPRGMSISRQNQLLVCDGEGRAWLMHI
uniref:Tripartite motif-containing protein 56 n=1 Tax=Magallana gigas TaxID=29159 RepID=K1QYV3_MAGGI